MYLDVLSFSKLFPTTKGAVAPRFDVFTLSKAWFFNCFSLSRLRSMPDFCGGLLLVNGVRGILLDFLLDFCLADSAMFELRRDLLSKARELWYRSHILLSNCPRLVFRSYELLMFLFDGESVLRNRVLPFWVNENFYISSNFYILSVEMRNLRSFLHELVLLAASLKLSAWFLYRVTVLFLLDSKSSFVLFSNDCLCSIFLLLLHCSETRKPNWRDAPGWKEWFLLTRQSNGGSGFWVMLVCSLLLCFSSDRLFGYISLLLSDSSSLY